MKVYQGVSEFKRIKNAVVTSGTFDGVHVGHQKIIQRLREIAQKISGETVLITFWPHPRYVLYPNGSKFHLLSSIEERTEILRQFGIDHLIIIPFTREFSNLSSEEFIKNILVEKIGTKKLVIGYDHRFGKNRSGSFEELKKDGPLYGFDVEEIPEQDVDNVAVSSTKIRKAIEGGDLMTANKYLGREYSIRGIVVKGDGLGKKLGYPTANIKIEFEHKLIPKDGIYAVRVKRRDNLYSGMLNVGFRPTVNGKDHVIEVNIYDFNEIIYGEFLEVFFVQKTRDEIKFNSLDALVSQLHKDKEEIMRILSR